VDDLETARLLCARGDILQAQITLEAALRTHPEDRYLKLTYASVLLQMGEWAAGLEQLEWLREHGPWQPVVEAYAGGALLGLNRVSDAQATLDLAFERDPHNIYVLLKRGELYCRLGIYGVAADALQSAQKLPCDDPTVREAVRRLLRFARKRSQSGFLHSTLHESRSRLSFGRVRRALTGLSLSRALAPVREEH
jgi:predicted Zn-dependent protease